MKIAVLGGGAGATVTAFDCAHHGHEVSLFDFPQFGENIAGIAERGGIEAEGDISGFANIVYAGHELDRALHGAELIYVVGPAFSTEPFGKAVAGKLHAGQTVIVTPGSCGGALAFKRAAGLAIDDETVKLAETHTLHYAVRLLKPAQVRVFLKLKGGNYLAGLPGRHTAEILELIKDVYPTMEAADSVMQTTLQNANPVIHPAVSLCNAARIEGAGDFLFYEEGVSDSVGRLIEAVDKERMALGRKIGVEIISDPKMGVRQGYMREASYGAGYRQAPGFRGITAQTQLDHRYLNEDVGWGLVFMSELGRQIGEQTPTIDAIIQLASMVMNKDYRAERPRTPEALGIGHMNAEQLRNL